MNLGQNFITLDKDDTLRDNNYEISSPYSDEVLETYRFWNMQLQSSFTEFLKDISSQAEKCRFLDRERTLRDKIVLSVCEKLRQLLFSNCDLDLGKTIEICESFDNEITGEENCQSLDVKFSEEADCKTKILLQDHHSEAMSGLFNEEFSILEQTSTAELKQHCDEEGATYESDTDIQCVEESSKNNERQIIKKGAKCSKEYICTHCNANFKKMYSLKIHLLRHTVKHTPLKSEAQKLRENPKLKLASLDCEECGKSFRSITEVKQHIRVHSGEKPFACDECERTFKKKSDLTVHKRIHTSVFSCSDCGKRYSRHADLLAHFRSHTGERPFACSVCNKTFKKKSHMKQHMHRHSENKKKFVCGECGKRFIDKGDLEAHKRTHTGERPFPCTQCDKSFKQIGVLKNHMFTHTAERPHMCDTCGKFFKTTVHLQRHTRCTHSLVKKFLCTVCNASFAESSQLRNHMRKHTGEKPYECHVCGRQFACISNRSNHMKIHSQTTVAKP